MHGTLYRTNCEAYPPPPAASKPFCASCGVNKPEHERDVTAENQRGNHMARCETCGNEYDKTFDVVKNGESHTFDSFECAIHAMAPHCEHCDCMIIGHGVEKDGSIYCCANCAAQEGATELRDRA